jgi:hypothetical protein
MNIEAVGAVRADGVGTDIPGVVWAAAIIGAAGEATGVRIER